MSYENLALFLIRLTVGSLMVMHGWPKIIRLSEWAKKMPGGIVLTLLVGLGELVFGFTLVVGILSRFSGFILTIIMVGTIPFMFKWHKPFFTGGDQAGWDYNLLLLVGAFAITLMGPGYWVLLS